MCLPCMSLCNCLPVLWVLCLPLIGSFCGPDAVLRLSLLMILHAILERYMQRILSGLLPFFNAALLVAFTCLPAHVVPFPLIWFYGQLVWLSEPLLLMVEGVEVIRIAMHLSRNVVANIEEYPIVVKSTILGASAIFYCAAIILGSLVYIAGSDTVRWLLLVVLIVAVVHTTVTLMKDEGIISDSAVVAACMFGALYAGRHEALLLENPLSEPKEWYNAAVDSQSTVQMMLSIGTLSLTHVTRATCFLHKILHPVFLIMVVIRVASIKQAVSMTMTTLREYMADEDVYEEEDLEEIEIVEDSCIPFVQSSDCLGRMNLPTKLSLIFIYTQLVFRTIEISGGHRPYRAYIPASVLHLLTSGVCHDVGLFRMMQIGVLGGVYPWMLRRSGEEEESW